jgi:drug/metabolite transporter (DMT)-like permease
VPLPILLLILLSALVHVSWNLLLRRSARRQLASWLSVIVAAALTLPFSLARVTPQLALIALAGAVLQAAYMLLLAYGYEHHDLSVLYPIARGAAPLFSSIWAALWLGDSISAGGIAAILLITGGTAYIGLHQHLAHHRLRLQALPLIIAVVISGYTVIDAFGTRTSDAFTYYSVCMAWTALLMAPIVLRSQPDLSRADLRAELPRAAAIGVLSFGAYLAVLFSYSQAPVSYVAATREISIVFAALIGWRWLKEPFGRPRLLGAAAVSLGVAALVLFG